MKNAVFVLFCTILFSCSPKVSLVVMKSYPARNATDTVHVYQKNVDVPGNAEALAKIAVYDAGTASNCGYDRVLAIAKTEVLKIGGNGLLITNHKLPSFWGSSCHQIEGTALKVGGTTNSDSIAYKPKPNYSFGNNSRKLLNKPPTHNFDVNIGYGLIYNRTKGLSGAEKKYEDDLSNGFTWDIQYSCFPKSQFGFGAIYSGYSSSATYNSITEKVLLSYIAPMFCTKSYLSKNWLLKCNVGLGYLAYQDTPEGISGKVTGSTLGCNVAIGVDYKISDNWGLGIELSDIAGSFGKLTQTENGQTTAINFDKDQRMGVSRVNFLIGLKYYIP